MKKLILSLSVFVASAGYAVQQYVTGNSTAPIATTVTPTTQVVSPTTSNTPPVTTPPIIVSTTPPVTVPVTLPVITTPVPTPKPKGQYADGTYTGAAADAYYGMVQIRVTIQGGKLVTVDFLQYPNDRRTSQYINANAMPQLKSEAIQAQSANVSGVSGASDTSQAFIQSLGDALSQAKNG